MSTRRRRNYAIPRLRTQKVPGPEFNSSQSSQLFVNCCFALSFGAVLFILTEALKQPLLLTWLPLTVYLTFLVWRQYRIYCLPVQYYRPEPESDGEEIVTLAITVFVALFTFSCIQAPLFSYVSFASIILLNLWKLRQIRNVLLSAPRQPSAAISDLQVFARHLWIYLVLLGLLLIVATAFHAYLGPKGFLLITALVPLLIYSGVQRVYREFSPQWKTQMSPKQYIESIALAFDTPNDPK